MKILVAGAGNVGRYLAGILVTSGHQVTLIESDESRIERARLESAAAVVLGDATEPSLLEANAVRTTDVVVAVTGDDEDNLVIASLAKFEFGVSPRGSRASKTPRTRGSTSPTWASTHSSALRTRSPS